MFFIFLYFLFVIPICASPTYCSSTTLILTVGVTMEDVICGGNNGSDLIVYPRLPEGLVMNNRTISGTPRIGQLEKQYQVAPSCYFDDIAQIITISIISEPTYISYGFFYAKVYAKVIMEPYYPRGDSFFTSYSITPALPSGMIFNDTDGSISGTPLTISSSTSYYIQAFNVYGMVSTRIIIEVIDITSLGISGITGIYFTTIQGFQYPSRVFFRSTDAKAFLLHNTIDFDDEFQYSHGGHIISGLDERFRDYYSAYFIGYIYISITSLYTFKLTTDDGGSFSIDSVDNYVFRTYRSGQHTEEGSITLTQGYHLLYVTYFEINYHSMIQLYYKCDTLSIPYTLVSKDIVTLGGRAPSFLHYNTITGIVNYPILSSSPTFASGYITEWSSSPSLPEGLTLNSIGVISGTPTSICNNIYTIRITGPLGFTEYSLHIYIILNPLQGIKATWYKIMNPYDFSNDKGFSDYITEKRVERIESIINYEELNENAVMSPGLTPDMYQKIYATFEGYLFFDEIGTWEIAAKVDDGIRIYFNNEFLFENWRIGSASELKSKVVYISNIGYYPIRIQYFQQYYGHAIMLLWRKPFYNNFFIIPSSAYYHVPSTILSYTNLDYIAYKNVAIVSNQVLWLNFSNSSLVSSNIQINRHSLLSSSSLSSSSFSSLSSSSSSLSSSSSSSSSFSSSLSSSSSSSSSFSSSSFSSSNDTNTTISNISTSKDFVYSITPSLPSGLLFNEYTGTITGTPHDLRTLTTYTITYGNYITNIQLEILYLEPPSGLYYLYNNILLTDTWDGTVGTYFEFKPIYTGRVDTWSCSPDPPQGVYIESFSGYFKGTPTESLNLYTMFTLSGCNQVGCSSFQIAISFPGCNNSHFYYTQLYSGSGSMKILKNNEIIYQQDMSKGIHRHCFIESNNMIYQFECSDIQGCFYTFYRDDTVYFFTDRITPNELLISNTRTYTFNTFFSSPSFSLSSSYSQVYRLQDITPIQFLFTSPYKSIIFTPSLPSTVYINYTTVELQGYWSAYGSYTYSIQAVNPNGYSRSQTLIIDVISCGETKTLIQVERHSQSYDSEETFTITQNNELLYTGHVGNDNEKRYTSICVNYGLFELNLYDQYNNGWSPGSTVVLYEENGYTIGQYTAPSVLSSPYTISINLDYTILKESIWKTSTIYEENWKKILFNDEHWIESKKGNYPSFIGNTIYLRQFFFVDSVYLYPILDISIYFIEGIIIYVNEIEVYRQNMPTSSSISYTTLATKTYRNYVYHRGSIPSYQLNNGMNIIAIEIHRNDINIHTFDFDFYAILMRGDAINRSDGITLTNSNSYNMPFETPYEAFDNDLTTKWLEDGLPAYIQIEYSFDRREFINRIQIYSANDKQERDPKWFTVSGSNDKGINWDLLLEVNQRNIWKERQQMKEWYIVNACLSYNMFRINIYESNGSVLRVQVSEIKLLTSQVTYCLRDGEWPATPQNTVVYIKCPENTFGLQSRSCSDDPYFPTWSSSIYPICYSNNPPSNTNYIDCILQISSVTLEGMQNGGDTLLKQALATYLSITDDSILTFLYRDISTDVLSITSVYIRITVQYSSSESITDYLISSLSSILIELKSQNINIFPSTTELTFIMSPEIRKSTSISYSYIFLIIVLSIFAILFIYFMISMIVSRNKSKKAKQSKLRSHSIKAIRTKSTTIITV
ncbi:hypothetical protein WA158_002281 [Blastocystis sp. Blastoise]